MGGYGVAIFFVLSGFLLSRPFWKAWDAGEGMPSLRVYFLRRVARIGPGFWLVLTLSLLFGWLFLDAPMNIGIFARYLAGLTFVGDLHWFTMFPVDINGPLWSIGFEVSSYIIMPIGFLALFALPIRSLPRVVVRILWVGVILAAIAVHWLYVQMVGFGRELTFDDLNATPFWHTLLGEYWFPQYNPIGFFAIFAIGALAGGVQVLLARYRSFWFDAGFAAALVWGGYMLWTNTEDTFDGIFHLPFKMYPELPVLVGAALAFGTSTKFLARALELRFIQYFARISFGVYLWHFLFIDLVRRFAFPEFVRLPITDRVADPGLLLSAFGLVLALTLLTAAASWRWLEEPAIRWAQRFEGKLLAPRLQAAAA